MGELAQMVERTLRMREVPGSIPGFSKSLFVFINFFRQTTSVSDKFPLFF